ncbi:hypothetical protein D9615_006287 [Tricholomella constricta]|uniref:Uncharacterized protein n=1 Tax=Tricholomella constricta TaxID=117010 RepID=A0A8H5M471_9AGAR|nr:hypothetical protein D9615_006287 [Tricholomella constricta]
MFRKVFASLITLIRLPVFLLPPSSSLLIPPPPLLLPRQPHRCRAHRPLQRPRQSPPSFPSGSPASRTVAFTSAQSEFEFGYKAVPSIAVFGAAIAAAILIITKRSNTSPDGEGAGLGNGANGAREHGNGPSIHNSEDASPVNGANGASCEHGNANINDLPSFPCATLKVTQDNNNNSIDIDIGSDIDIDNDPPELSSRSTFPIPNALIVVTLIIHATQTSSPDQAKAKTIVKPGHSIVVAVPVRVLAPTAGLIARTIAAKSILERKDLFARAAALSSTFGLVVAARREGEVAESDVTVVAEDSMTMIQDEEEEEGEGELLNGLDSLDVSSTVRLPVDDGSQYLGMVPVIEDEPVEAGVEAGVAKVEIAPTLKAVNEATAVVEEAVASKGPQDDQAQVRLTSHNVGPLPFVPPSRSARGSGSTTLVAPIDDVGPAEGVTGGGGGSHHKLFVLSHIFPHFYWKMAALWREYSSRFVREAEAATAGSRRAFGGEAVRHGFMELPAVGFGETPNHILETTDVHPQHHQTYMSPTVSYPSRDRYTLQWLINEDSHLPNNLGAAFKTGSRKPKPSGLLLHYNYGVAAVKHWGHGTDLLTRLANPPRPSKPVPPLAGPSKSIHDRTIAITKRGRSQGIRESRGGHGGRGKKATAGDGEMVEASWDADDVVLFLWGNSPVAKEHHRKKVEETTRRMETWRAGVAQGSA